MSSGNSRGGNAKSVRNHFSLPRSGMEIQRKTGDMWPDHTTFQSPSANHRPLCIHPMYGMGGDGGERGGLNTGCGPRIISRPLSSLLWALSVCQGISLLSATAGDQSFWLVKPNLQTNCLLIICQLKRWCLSEPVQCVISDYKLWYCISWCKRNKCFPRMKNLSHFSQDSSFQQLLEAVFFWAA